MSDICILNINRYDWLTKNEVFGNKQTFKFKYQISNHFIYKECTSQYLNYLNFVTVSFFIRGGMLLFTKNVRHNI